MSSYRCYKSMLQPTSNSMSSMNKISLLNAEKMYDNYHITVEPLLTATPEERPTAI